MVNDIFGGPGAVSPKGTKKSRAESGLANGSWTISNRTITSLKIMYLPRIATLTAGSTHSLKQLFEQHFFVSPPQSPSKMHSSVSEVQTPDGGLSLVGHAPGRGSSSHGRKYIHTTGIHQKFDLKKSFKFVTKKTPGETGFLYEDCPSRCCSVRSRY